MQKNMTENASAVMEGNAQILADALRLNYEKIEKPDGKDIVSGGGTKIYGKYKNHDIEIIWFSYTKIKYQLGKNVMEYLIDNHISIKGEKTSENWVISPISKPVTKPTGVVEFDNILTISGNHSFTHQDFQFIASFGWMNLKMQNGILTFSDDFNEFIQNTKGVTAMTKVVHPLWHTSTANLTIDIPNVINFIDFLIYAAG